MQYLRSVFGKKQIILAIAGAASLLLAGILTLVGVHASKGLDAENLASRWSKNGDFSQVSCFFSQLADVSEETVAELNYKIGVKLTGDSLKAEKEGARTWLHAFSANGQAQVDFKNFGGSFKAVGVGGDYFLFHPLKLVYGNYFSDDTPADDLVIIDKEVAGQLFGGTDVVGQIVEIGGRQHIVCGVYEREKGRINDLAGNDKPTVYLPYSSLKENGTITYLNMYEALMPNPISGYAKSAIKDNLKVDEAQYEMVENTGRFKWYKLVMNAKNFGIRGMNAKAIVYPYWENVARGMEDYLTPVAILALILYLFPSVLLFLLILRMWKLRPIHMKNIMEFVDDRIDVRRRKNYEKALKQQEEAEKAEKAFELKEIEEIQETAESEGIIEPEEEAEPEEIKEPEETEGPEETEEPEEIEGQKEPEKPAETENTKETEEPEETEEPQIAEETEDTEESEEKEHL